MKKKHEKNHNSKYSRKRIKWKNNHKYFQDGNLQTYNNRIRNSIQMSSDENDSEKLQNDTCSSLNQTIDDFFKTNNIDLGCLITEKTKKTMLDLFETTVINDRGFEEPNHTEASLNIEDDSSEECNNESIQSSFKFFNDDEDYEVTDEQIEVINNLMIKMHFNIPPLHYHGRREISKRQRNKLKLTGLTYKTGKFLKTEDDIIKKNFNEFCELHNIPKKPLIFIHLNYKKIDRIIEREFCQFLSKGLPDRLVSSVFKRFCLIYNEHKHGKFSEYEDRLIMEHMKMFQGERGAYSYFKTKINRSARCIHRHYQIVLKPKQNGYSISLGKNINHLLLIKEIMRELNVSNINDLKELKSTTSLFFQPIAERLQIIPLALQRVWLYTTYIRLFVKERNKSVIVMQILNIMIEEKIDDFRKVDYVKYSNEVEGTTPYFISIIVYKIKKMSDTVLSINNILEKLKYMQKWMIRKNFKHIPTIDVSKLDI